MVDTLHTEYIKWRSIWQRIKDCIDGQDAVKEGREIYLPKLNGQDEYAYNKYLQRAQFTDFSARTLNIALGQLFRKNPVVIDVDEEITNNINLSKQSLYYFSRDVAEDVMKYNRCGILVDYSEKEKRPYIVKYNTFEIINWGFQNNKLSFVVLEGYIKVQKENDMFEAENQKIYRVLWINDGVYTVSVYAENTDKQINEERFIKIEEDKIPIKNGNPFDYIPFYFLTSNGINTNIQKSVMYGFVNVNLGHYINSADLENMLHWTAAKTLVTKGFGDDKPVPIGGSFDLPTDGDAFYLEASSDSGLNVEMDKKKEQMAAMGASLISSQGRYVASAETSRINSQGEYATLSDLSKSLSTCMTEIMKELVEWHGKDSKNITITYNTDFELSEIDPNMLTAYMGAVQSGYMSWETFFYNMKNKELYPQDWTIESEKKAIEEGQEEIEEPVMPNEDNKEDE
ncbi:MAG: DUF4055 domain-containing protein [Ignavibacteria bacterium]|jgi:hypothetical protein